MSEFSNAFSGFLDYFVDGATLLIDFYEIFPPVIQQLLFAIFGVVFGTALITYVIKIIS